MLFRTKIDLGEISADRINQQNVFLFLVSAESVAGGERFSSRETFQALPTTAGRAHRFAKHRGGTGVVLFFLLAFRPAQTRT